MKHVIKTNIGVVRKENQDKAAVFEGTNFTFAILCDGMGGHEGGAHASSITIDTFEREVNKLKRMEHTQQNLGTWFMETLVFATKAMKKFANNNINLLDMGTTVTAALVTNEKIYIYNVGDSRTYVYNGILKQITIDHNLRNRYIKKYNYTAEQAATIVGAAALTSALGPKKKATIEKFVLESTSGIDYIILTSDGIHDYISKPNFESIIASNISLDEKASLLIQQAIRGKSSDNLTTIIMEFN